MSRREWTSVTKAEPCPACKHDAWCAWSRAGMLKCERTTVPPDGMVLVSEKGNGAVFAWADNRVRMPRRWSRGTTAKAPTKVKHEKKPKKVHLTIEAAAACYRSYGKPTGQWDYPDAGGALVMRVFRFPKPADPDKPNAKPAKHFRPVSRVEGGWVAADPDGLIPLYRLPELLAAPKGFRVIVVEGERKCDAARELGWIVTASAHGCGGAFKSDWSPVCGQHVVVFLDRDDGGEKYGKAVTELAYAAGALSVRIVRLWDVWPEMPDAGDIVDLIEHRQNDLEVVRAEVEGLMDRANEEPRPPVVQSPLSFKPVSAISLMREYPELGPAVIDGLVRRGEVVNVIAAPKVGKTRLAHLLAVAVVSGGEWLGMKAIKGKVLLIDGELHPQTLSFRMQSIQSAMGISAADMESVMIETLRGRCVDVYDLQSMLSNVAHGEYAVIILDALYRFLPEGCEENSNESMMRVYNALDAIAAVTGSAIAVVHHSSKGVQSTKAITDVGSGGGAQSRAADSHLVLREHEVDDAVVVEAALRSFAPMKPFVIRNTYPGWELAPELDPKKLRRSGGRAAKSEKTAEDKPKAATEVWTPERFAKEVVGDRNMIKEDVIARAVEVFGMKKTPAEELLRRAVSGELVKGLPPGMNLPLRFNVVGSSASAAATEPKVIPGGEKGGGGGCVSPPIPPRATARGFRGTTTPPLTSPQAPKRTKAKKGAVPKPDPSANTSLPNTLGGAA